MYKFLTLLLITIALLVFFIETKDSGLVTLPTKIQINDNGLIRIWYDNYDQIF